MNFFFGDIKEPTSRAVDLDDEEDDDTYESSCKTLSSFTLTFEEFNPKPEIKTEEIKMIFITFGHPSKSQVITDGLFGSLVLRKTPDSELQEVIGRLYKINESIVCFQINQRVLSVNSWLVTHLMTKCINQFGTLLPKDVYFVIIAREANRTDYIQFIENKIGSPDSVLERLFQKKVISPDMITDFIESHLLEILTITQTPCALLKLPVHNTTKLLGRTYPSPLWNNLIAQSKYLTAPSLLYS